MREDAVIAGLKNGLAERSDDWEVTLRKAHHRTLTLLVAGLRLDLVRGSGATFPKSVDRFEERILAFGRLHHLLSNGPGNQPTAVVGYFEELCGALSAAILEPSGTRCEVAIEDGLLCLEQCHRLALIVTELVTNAAKPALPNSKPGVIRIKARYWDGSWHCSVADNRTGTTGARQGAGGRILYALARSIGTKTTMRSGRRGTAVTAILPAAL